MKKSKNYRGFNYCEECGRGLQTEDERDMGLCNSCQYKQTVDAIEHHEPISLL